MMLWWQLAAVVGGLSTGLLGVYVVGLRMPFLGVGIAHAAMAGGVVATVAGLPMLPVAVAASLASGGALAWHASARTRTDLGTSTGILLSLTMGVAFLGMGLHKGDMTPLLSLLWGSLLFVRPEDVILMAVLGAALLLFVVVWHRPLDTLLFSRPLARATGVRVRALTTAFLLLASLIVALNLNIVGGLMIYSLLTNPAAAAYEVGGSMRAVRLFACAFGLASTLGGFWASYAFDLPTGACIVIASTLVYAAALAAGRRRGTTGAA